MGRGVLVGVMWGAIASVILLVLLSLSAPLPERTARLDRATPAPGVPPLSEVIPEGALEALGTAAEPAAAPEQTPAPAADAPPATPGTGSDPARADTPAARGTDTAATAPSQGVPLPAGSEFNRPPPQEPAALPATDAAPDTAAPRGASLPAPDVLTESTAPDTASAPQPQPGMVAAPRGPAPADAAISVDPAAPLANLSQDPLAPPPGLQPAPLGLPQIETGATSLADPPAATTTLPGVVVPDLSEPAPEAPLAEPPADDAGAQAEALPAIIAHAAPFDASETRPLMSVVLIDDPAYGMDRAVLTDLPFPVTFAIDPTRPGAAEDAASFRAAGFEVLILADILPPTATHTDAEVALAAAMDTIPGAVGVMDTTRNLIQGNRPILDAVVNALAETGHGLVAYPRGLNAAEQSAERLGVPAATLFREIDAEQERATVISRYLDRAGFAAGQEGSVIVVGHTYPDTITALFSWALGDRSESVALAPASAVLTR